MRGREPLSNNQSRGACYGPASVPRADRGAGAMKKTILFDTRALALGSAQAGNLLPAGAADQQPSRLVAAPLPAGDFERQPVSMAWPMDSRAQLSAPAPHQAESREYWATVEAA